MIFYLGIIFIDILLIYLGLFTAIILRFSTSRLAGFYQEYFLVIHGLALACLISLIMGKACLPRFRSKWELFTAIFRSLFTGIVTGISLAYIFRLKLGGFPSSVFATAFFIISSFLFFTRAIIYKYAGRLKRAVVFLNEKELTNFRKLLNRDIDDLVICSNLTSDQIYLLIDLANRRKIKLFVLPELYHTIFVKKANERDEFLHLLPAYLYGRNDDHFLRIFDIITAIILLFFSLPVMFLIILAVKINSAGTVLYKQLRVGLNGKMFELYKFRSMILEKELVDSAGNYQANHVKRVTSIGGILRRTRLDELPQIINVLRGDMSMVGPRPEAVYRVKEHRAFQGIRLCVRPGITGLAQVEGTYDTQPRHKLRYDYLYIRNCSLPLNLKILAKTVLIILFKKGS